MKNMTKILALLLCAGMVYALTACGGNDADEKGSGTDASAVSDTASDDGIYLPEDGKITFGKDKKQTDDTTNTTDTTDTVGSDAVSGEKTGEVTEPSETDGNNEYGGIGWNK